ncbi:DUF4286 family protein [Croceiramulus getboli]|nr:DUF4286 family protein [Flavobacteriaceae bacterium YJPT1-3]
MIIYNVTINIEEHIQQEWLQWMKETHIPEMLSTGKFVRALMTRVLVDEEMGGYSYSIQYLAENREILDRYYQEDAPRLRATSKRFEGKFVAFRTELEVIGEHQRVTSSTPG